MALKFLFSFYGWIMGILFSENRNVTELWFCFNLIWCGAWGCFRLFTAEDYDLCSGRGVILPPADSFLQM